MNDNEKEISRLIDNALWSDSFQATMKRERPNEIIYLTVSGEIIHLADNLTTKRYRIVEV